MNTITEDYVSFETAKLLKENGFDGECDLFGRTDESESTLQETCKITYNQGIDDECVIIPTHQMTIKWLREVHNLQIQIAPITSKHKDWTFGIYKEFSPLTIDLLCFPTYEEACEAAIKYCLEKLI